MEPKPFREVFEPVVRVKENLELIPEDHPKHGYYKVLYIEQLPEFIHDFGSIAGEGSVADVKVENIYMPDSELAQYRFHPIDDLEIKIKQPSGISRFKTKHKWLAVTSRTHQQAPKMYLSEFFVIEDEGVYFTVTNPAKSTTKKSRVKFFGWRFVLEKLAEKPDRYTPIPVGGR